ncbi:MAG: hypothetical protein K1X75_03255 [Leptospirales bacterium]|nr:hypothetical protein [Leptospirales bacterium]
MEAEVVRKRIQAPAVALIALFSLSLLVLLLLAAHYFRDVLGEFWQPPVDNEREGLDTRRSFPGELLSSYPFGAYLIFGVWSVFSALALVGAVQMYRGRSYGFAMVSTVLALLPCLWSCSGLGLPFGIWSLLVLLRAETREYFGLRPRSPSA